jgi:hypothetical protein
MRPSQGRYLHSTTQTQNILRQTSMPSAGFEPTIPAFDWAKTVHALERAATVIGTLSVTCNVIIKDICDTQRNVGYDNKLDQDDFLISLLSFQLTENFETGTIRMRSC